jgi:multidrug efflux system membrane fusion protein
MVRRGTAVGWLACALGAGLLAGCGQPAQQEAPEELPVVPVSHPVGRMVTDYVYYTGRTDAVSAVGIRPRVTGYLVQMPFKEGSEVKKGDLLFEVDPRPYEDQLKLGEAQLASYQAAYELAEANFKRAATLRKNNGISAQEYDQDKATRDQAVAQVDAAKANVSIYKLNLSFTKVTSPIDGMVSRYYLTLGNLAIQDQTLLTTVVSLDPMYVYFDMDEPTVLRIINAIAAGRIKRATTVPIDMALPGEDGYPHVGYFNFVNNAVNPSTGTISVRGVYPNPKLNGGVRLLKPGMFVRVRLPIGAPHDALLVIDRAVGSDQGIPFVYVLDKENKIQYRRVKTGPLQEDGLRVIDSGVQPGDWVVVGAVQQVRPHMKVEPDEGPMPSIAGNPAPAPAGNRPQAPPPGQNRQVAPGPGKAPPAAGKP